MYPSITNFVNSIVCYLIHLWQQSCKSERSMYQIRVHPHIVRPTVRTVWDVNSLITRDECLQRSFYALYTCNGGRYDEYRSGHIAFLFYTAPLGASMLIKLGSKIIHFQFVWKVSCLHITKMIINFCHFQLFSFSKIILFVFLYIVRIQLSLAKAPMPSFAYYIKATGRVSELVATSDNTDAPVCMRCLP